MLSGSHVDVFADAVDTIRLLRWGLDYFREWDLTRELARFYQWLRKCQSQSAGGNWQGPPDIPDIHSIQFLPVTAGQRLCS